MNYTRAEIHTVFAESHSTTQARKQATRPEEERQQQEAKGLSDFRQTESNVVFIAHSSLSH